MRGDRWQGRGVGGLRRDAAPAIDSMCKASSAAQLQVKHLQPRRCPGRRAGAAKGETTAKERDTKEMRGAIGFMIPAMALEAASPGRFLAHASRSRARTTPSPRRLERLLLMHTYMSVQSSGTRLQPKECCYYSESLSKAVAEMHSPQAVSSRISTSEMGRSPHRTTESPHHHQSDHMADHGHMHHGSMIPALIRSHALHTYAHTPLKTRVETTCTNPTGQSRRSACALRCTWTFTL